MQAFSGLVLRERVIALDALDGLARTLGVRLDGTETLVDLLEHWDANRATLNRLVAALDAEDGAGTWSQSLDLDHVRILRRCARARSSVPAPTIGST